MDWPSDFNPVDVRHRIVKRVFSTIISPVFSEIVIVLNEWDIAYSNLEVAMFETLRKMHEAKPFQLAFLPKVSESLQ